MSWTDLQIALVRALAAYLSAEEASRIVCDSVQGQWRKADALHDELLTLALLCGYEPAGMHRDLSTVQWARKRAANIARSLPAHLKEAKL